MAIAYSKPDEDIEKILRRFKRQVKEENILQEVRDREAYEKPSVVRKAEQKERERNNTRRMKLEDQ